MTDVARPPASKAGSTVSLTGACGDYVTLAGMTHAVYCRIDAGHGSEREAHTRIAGGGIAYITWTDDED